jgi:hypothetical protein
MAARCEGRRGAAAADDENVVEMLKKRAEESYEE